LLEQLRRGGDSSEATAIALALGYMVEAQVLDIRNDPAGPITGKKAAELLRPLAEGPNASPPARRAYVSVLVHVGYEQVGANQNQEAVRTEQLAMRLATDLGAHDLSNLEMGANYADAGAWLVAALSTLGRNDEARRAGADAMGVADKILERRPGYRLALHAEQVIQNDLAQAASNDLNPAESLQFAERGVQISNTLLQLDPASTVSTNNLGVAHQGAGDALWAMGRMRDAIPYYLKSLDDYGRATSGGTGFVLVHGYDVAQTGYHRAQFGDAQGAAATIASGEPYLARLRRSEPGSIAVIIVDGLQKLPTAGAAFEVSNYKGALRVVGEALNEVEATKPAGGQQEFQKFISLFVGYHLKGRAEYLLGDYTAAEKAERASLEARSRSPIEAVGDRRDIIELSTWLGMAVARQGRLAEAEKIVAPAVKFHRGLDAKNHGDQWQHVELASALYAQSLVDTAHRAALLREAAAKLDALPAAMRPLHDVKLWREFIRTAQRGAG
jgi:tetratricopeptide (TPR) repeat protein